MYLTKNILQPTAAEEGLIQRVVATIDAMKSNPIKPLSTFRGYKRYVTAYSQPRNPSARQAAALALACLKSGKGITNGASFSRKFAHNGVECAIENRVLGDAIRSRLCNYNGDTETITLLNAAAIGSLFVHRAEA